MALEFECPACGGKLKAPIAATGIMGACQYCGAQIMSPQRPGAPGILVVPPAQPNAAGPAPDPAPPSTPLPQQPGGAGFGGARPGYGDPGRGYGGPGSSPTAHSQPVSPFPPGVSPVVDNVFENYDLSENGDYANLIGRGVACIIDFALLALIAHPLAPFADHLSAGVNGHLPDPLVWVIGNIPLLLFYSLFGAAMESSPLQATPGKLVIGAIVTDITGDRTTFWRALVRNLVKYSTVPLTSGIVLLVALFHDLRQGLHDIAASTIVLNK